MQQLTQSLKKGQIEIREVSLPMIPRGHILVRNHYSLISAGTESSTVATARKSMLGKARARPQQAKQVFDVLRTQGPIHTYRTVMKKLDAYSPLGYSCAGEIVSMADDVKDFHVGDLVACAGGTASHGEYVSVPINLSVKLPRDTDMRTAAFNALGAIAMQGIRRANLNLGESCAVIGLGLIGQLTSLMLKSSGVQVFGVDIDSNTVKRTMDHICDAAFTRNTPGLAEKIDFMTQGLGVDAVIITAGTSSLDPVNFAGRICRKRGSVVVVGAVPTGFEREPDYYRKELDLRMSCSYGPGRYDPNFEDKGIDYPAAYVRWTENRNMQSFHKLIENKSIDVASLITHEFAFENVAAAYELILGRTEPYFGVLLSYDVDKPSSLSRIKEQPKAAADNNGVSFIGAGSYAQSYLLPNIRKINSVNLRGVVTNSGTTSQRVADQYDFDYCGDDPAKVFSDEGTSTVFIATRHNTHALYVLEGLKAGKNVYVEKPLCLTAQELQDIAAAHMDSDKHLMVGFNRRFSPHVVKVKNALSSTPMSIIYRVNAGKIPAESWIQDMDVGGGRIIGEGCHFIDLIIFLTASLPTRIYASSMQSVSATEDTITITIEFENGSIGTVHYFSNGDKSLAKEYIEIFQDGTSHVIDDFKVTSSYRSSRRPDVAKSAIQNKGQTEMMTQFVSRVEKGGEALIPFPQIYAVAATSLAAVASLRHHLPVNINSIVSTS